MPAWGSIMGVIVLAIGIPLIFLQRRSADRLAGTSRRLPCVAVIDAQPAG